MDEELKRRISDYFDSWELIEYLQVPTSDIVDLFEDKIVDVLEDIEELMGIT